MEKTWEYETKCRRCGILTDWYFSSSGQMKWVDFANAIQDFIRNPRFSMCDKCKKSTVQDVVSYTDFNS